MTVPFNPYLKWLGIRDEQRPLNYYRLLGLEKFEDDTEVISSAADRQIKHVQSFAEGPHADASRQLVAELELAKRCLADSDSREKYNQQLQEQSSAPVIEIQTGAIPQISTSIPDNTSIVKPAIKPGKPRKKQNHAFSDFIGWVLGAVGAVVFAWVLLNTSILDQMRGRKPATVSSNVAKQSETRSVAVNPNSAKSKKKQRRNPSGRKAAEPEPVAKTTSEAESLAVKESNLPVPDSLKRSPKPGKSSSKHSSAAGKAAKPDAKSFSAAKKAVREQYKTQFESRNENAKQILAKTLLSNSLSRKSEPETQYAMLDLSAELASDLGDLNTTIASIRRMDENFGINYWDTLRSLALTAISKNTNFESTAAALNNLLETARAQEKFEIAEEFAVRASKSIRQQGDAMQYELLTSFARDMREMSLLKKDYESATVSNQESPGPNEQLQTGKYLCFGKNDWTTGLAHLASGSDSGLAKVAKRDLETSDNGGILEVAEAWFKLRAKSMYNGLDRRCMTERALEKYKVAVSSGIKSESFAGANESLMLARHEVQIVKQYVDDPASVSRRVIVFAINGPASFDSAQLEHGKKLRFGLGEKIKFINVKKNGKSYTATTDDRSTRFKIRLLDTGFAEMRIYNQKNSALKNILYGK